MVRKEKQDPPMLLVDLDDAILLPGGNGTIPLDPGEREQVVVVPRRSDGKLAQVGTLAQVLQQFSFHGLEGAIVLGQERVELGDITKDKDNQRFVKVSFPKDIDIDSSTTDPLVKELRAITDEMMQLGEVDYAVRQFISKISDPGSLADAIALNPNLEQDTRIDILEEINIVSRLKLAIHIQREQLLDMQLRKRIREEVENDTFKQQKEYLLRKQMKEIQEELGEDSGSVVGEYKLQIEQAHMPEKVEKQAINELGRLERMGEMGLEQQVIRSYLDWLLALPWNQLSEDNLDLIDVEDKLDADHTGLSEIKARILEYLAVRKLRQDRNIEIDPKSGAILTLVGPPGTGKTSLGESIAHALGREYIRIALGGIRDESEIRGHRRTYVGAMPGRIARALRDAKTMNPIIVLDEVDKVGNDWKGDPASALLEVLDPAQNHSFRDHYLDVELDLSKVIFIATANQVDPIPDPLRDRMEMIYLDGYTVEEKVAIAKQHLWPRQLSRNGLLPDEIAITNSALALVVENYTREAGVRQLEQQLGKILRKTARAITQEKHRVQKITVSQVQKMLGKDMSYYGAGPLSEQSPYGVVLGLAVTAIGGDVLHVEAAQTDSKLIVTGQIGDVMKESAQIALSYVKSHTKELGIQKVEGGFHIHVPAGSISKDGPSAGVTMFTALVSLLTQQKPKTHLAMTGEITLQGRVLAIGGVKQKILAAQSAGITEVILPYDNRQDIKDIPISVRNKINIHLVQTLDEVLAHAF